MKHSVERIKKQIERLMAQYSEADYEYPLNTGASEADFDQLEAVIGCALPEDFNALYRVHNGEQDFGNGVLDGEEWLSIERVIDEYTIWRDLYEDGVFLDGGKDFGCEPDVGIKPDYWWNPKWVPLTADGGGNGKMIDLDPSSAGTYGQVIQMWHDEGVRSVIAPSLRVFFEQYADALEAGQYVIHPDYGIVNTDDLSDEELAEL